nr:acyltransferase [Bradyrhizobium brasilense]
MLDRQKGFGPGFDFLRIALAISVVAAHAPYVAGGSGDGEQAWIAWFPHYAILVMFFALSGFLIAASGLRLSLREFLTNRGMRIIPALAVEIVLSALILGPIFTALPLSDYFTNFGTYKYFTNIIGLVNYVLPGVFSGNPAPEVNSSLWTVPFEYGCYALMTVFILFGLLRKPPLIVLGALVLVGIGLALVLTGHGAQTSQLPAGVAGTLHDRIFSTAPFLGRGAKLPVAFMLGIAIYLYRDRIPYNGWLLAACCALCAGAVLLGPADWIEPAGAQSADRPGAGLYHRLSRRFEAAAAAADFARRLFLRHLSLRLSGAAGGAGMAAARARDRSVRDCAAADHAVRRVLLALD